MLIFAAVRAFHKDQEGGAYTLSYVMVIPVILLLICLVVESTLFMCAKLGTVHAAYSAGRSLSVWSSVTDWGSGVSKAEWAAQRAFAPFASGLADGREPPTLSAQAEDYLEANQAFANPAPSEGYTRRKLADATGSLRISVDSPPDAWNSQLRLEVHYEYPFRIPGIGRVLGKAGPRGYVMTIRTAVVVPNEGPQNTSQQLGIGYGKQP